MALPTGLRKRGSVYYSQFKDPATGAWKRKALGPDLGIAIKHHARLRQLSEDSRPPQRTFQDLVEPWMRSQEVRCKPRSVDSSRKRAGLLMPHFGALGISEITAERIDQYIRQRRRQGLRDVTINGHLTTLRQVLRYGEEIGLVQRAPKIKLLRVVKKMRRRTLDRAQVAKLLRCADQWPGSPATARKVKAFLLIAASTGMRQDEILHLRWEDVDFDDARLDLRAKEWTERRWNRFERVLETRDCKWSPKTHQERSVWTDTRVLEFLKDYRETLTCRAPSDWVFQGARPGLRLTTIANPLRATFKWSGLYEKGKLAHTLRHSVATELLASGVDLETVRDVLGHSNVTTTALYLHTIDERKRRAARQLKLV